MSHSSVLYESVSIDVKIDSRDYTDISSALIVDPRAIRERLLSVEDKKIISDIAECVISVGPRPDRVLAKLATRTLVPIDIANKIRTRTEKIDTFCKKHSIRGTQFQAAFPDLIFKGREKLIKDNVKLQRFCPDEILPLIFQFPGSGPIIPDIYRSEDNYGQFNVELTKALSQGKLNVNWTIINKSLEWRVNVEGIEKYDPSIETEPIPYTPSSTKTKEKKTKEKGGK